MKTIKLSGDALAAALEVFVHGHEVQTEIEIAERKYRDDMADITLRSNQITVPLMTRIYGPHNIDFHVNRETGDWSVLIMIESGDAFLINAKENAGVVAPVLPNPNKNRMN